MYHVAAFYKFCPLDVATLPSLRDAVRDFCHARDLRGLFLLAPEGINATMCGTETAIAELVAYLEATPEIGALTVKHSTCAAPAFDRLKVETRPEIVSLGRPDTVPTATDTATHLSPAQWHERITSGENVLLLDTRNDYEVGIGAFRGAVNPHTADFAQFPDYVRSANLPRDTPVLMYCTGGIRCEKAALVLREHGYANVFQLSGGILNYLKQYPNGAFDGECFVFDRRIAVDRNLQPTTTYTLCPLCGDPASTAITCAHCAKPGTVCRTCAAPDARRVCSQNCEYHLSLRANPKQYRHRKQ